MNSMTSKSISKTNHEETVKILGIPEKDPKLKISEDLKIERAHRVGKTRPPFRHAGGRKVESQPRPIVLRFQLWKEKERVIKQPGRSDLKGLNSLKISPKEH